MNEIGSTLFVSINIYCGSRIEGEKFTYGNYMHIQEGFLGDYSVDFDVNNI